MSRLAPLILPILAAGLCLSAHTSAACQRTESPQIKNKTGSASVTWAGKSFGDNTPDRVVIHCVAALRKPDGKSRPTQDWFDLDAIVEIFSHYKTGPHYIVERDGTITCWVSRSNAAVHATIYNSRSIGIELVGLNDESWVRGALHREVPKKDWDAWTRFTDQQYSALDDLLEVLKSGRGGGAMRAITHSDIRDTAEITSSILDLRASPSASSPLVSQLSKRTKLQLLGDREAAGGYTWYSVRTTEKEVGTRRRGWVPGKYIKRLVRKRDPNSQFDRAKIEAMDFVDHTDF